MEVWHVHGKWRGGGILYLDTIQSQKSVCPAVSVALQDWRDLCDGLLSRVLGGWLGSPLGFGGIVAAQI